MGSQTTTETTTIPGMGKDEGDARATLTRLSKELEGQLGDLSGLAQGNLTLSPQDEELIKRINSLSMEQARAEAKRNYEEMAGSVEEAALGKGIEGSSMEAVNRAVLGRQLQGTLDDVAKTGQIKTAEQMRAAQLENAGIKLNANQLLLNQILGASSSTGQLGLQERLAQTTTKKETPMDFSQMAGLGMKVGQFAANPGSAIINTVGA